MTQEKWFRAAREVRHQNKVIIDILVPENGEGGGITGGVHQGDQQQGEQKHHLVKRRLIPPIVETTRLDLESGLWNISISDIGALEGRLKI